MQCPRCGLQNQPGISACARCGLPVQPPPAAGPPNRPEQPPPAGGPGPSSPYQPMPPPLGQPPTAQPPTGQPSAGQPPTGHPPRPTWPQQPPATSGWPPYGPTAPTGSSGSEQTAVLPGATAAGPAGGGYGPPAPGAYDPQRTPYPGGASAAGTGWPTTTSPGTAATSGGVSRLLPALLGLAALLSLAYAVWAFTARRGIFQDFADGRSVSVDDAKSSDLLDTIFLVVAGLVAVIAIGLWLAQLLGKRTGGGGLEKAGLAVALLGAVAVLVGLFLASGVTDSGDQASQGEEGVTATMVVGGGFALLAIGLLMGLLAALRAKPDGDYGSPATAPATGYAGWPDQRY